VAQAVLRTDLAHELAGGQQFGVQVIAASLLIDFEAGKSCRLRIQERCECGEEDAVAVLAQVGLVHGPRSPRTNRHVPHPSLPSE
jgi:hypothetical protein